MTFMKKHAFKIAVIALCAAMGIYLWISSMEKTAPLKVIEPAPQFEMTDINGDTVTLQDTDGKVRLFYFFFASCPDVCPPTTAQLAEIQEKTKAEGTFGKDFVITSTTFDPVNDTPEKLRKYAENFDVDFSGWYFLRDTEEKARKMAKDFKLIIYQDKDGQFSHANYIFLVDKKGQIRRYIEPLEKMDVNEVVRDINRLIKEK
ncbi:SCO family protein [Paenibacillaceae bacterium]|nr:SCO family protein [Paenibacillaceae bacterium]